MTLDENSTFSELHYSRLDGTQDVRNATGLQQNLIVLTSTTNPVVIDCSAIESLDAAFLQLLLAAKRERPNTLQITFEPTCEAACWINFAGLTTHFLAAPCGT